MCVLAQESEKVFHIQKRSCDCRGALPVSDKIGPLVANYGFGFSLEILQKDETPYVIDHETNTVWYKYRSKKSGSLVLDIIPINPSEDFNFMLYISPGPWFCENFKDEYSLYPARSNLSATSGNTGLNTSATEEVVSYNQATPYSMALPINAGDEVYLVVDTETKISAGHKVEFRVE